MNDIALDDLIAKDKEKNKFKNKHRGQTNRNRGARGRLNRRGSGHQRPNSRLDRERPDKRRPIRKDRRDLDRDQNRPRKFGRLNRGRDQPRSRPKDEKRQTEKKERQPKQSKQQAQKQEKGRTLKVLGLHPDITNQDLYKLFAAEGALQKCMIEQDNFGRNLPSALVKYYNAETAKKAIENINSKKVMNSVLTVEPYKHSRK